LLHADCFQRLPSWLWSRCDGHLTEDLRLGPLVLASLWCWLRQGLPKGRVLQ
jgi:hypothetical protein